MRTNQVKKQKGFLQIAFVIVFTISFALVVIENLRINRQTSDNPAQNITAKIRGQSATKAPQITDYEAIVRAALIGLNKNIDFILQDKQASIIELRSVYNSLLSAQIPSIYKSLHFDLLQLTKISLSKSSVDKVDKEEIREKRKQIFEQYPYLAKVIQK